MHSCTHALMLAGKTVAIEIRENDLIEAIHREIECREGIPRGLQWLSFDGKPLSKGRTAQDYNIHNETTLELMRRLNGGMESGDAAKNGKSIAFYSFKGGSGKSTALQNVAASLTRQGKRACMLDFDPQCNTSGFFNPGNYNEFDENDEKEAAPDVMSVDAGAQPLDDVPPRVCESIGTL